jgi:hypothetical protein
MRTSILQLALHKIHRHDRDVWCGYLTAAEGQALLDDGVLFHEATVQTHQHMLSRAAQGECGQTWYYFTLGRTRPDEDRAGHLAH